VVWKENSSQNVVLVILGFHMTSHGSEWSASRGTDSFYIICFILAFIIIGELIYLRRIDSHFVSLFLLTSVQ
jgi:hypothetical protein